MVPIDRFHPSAKLLDVHGGGVCLTGAILRRRCLCRLVSECLLTHVRIARISQRGCPTRSTETVAEVPHLGEPGPGGPPCGPAQPSGRRRPARPSPPPSPRRR